MAGTQLPEGKSRSIEAPFYAGDADEVPISSGVRWSLVLHALLAGLITIKSLYFPGEATRYVPTLRVDIVGLPDLLKKDMERLKTGGAPKPSPEEAAERAKEKPPEPKSDEMVQKKKAPDKDRKARIRNALDRIKALQRIREGVSEEEAPPVIKGNIVSPGTTLSGDAREAAAPSYYDSVLERLRLHWSLPVWLQRMNLSAQVRVGIDARGNVLTMRFIRSSGNAQFDDAVKSTIVASQPFGPPPDDVRGSVMSDGILLGFPL